MAILMEKFVNTQSHFVMAELRQNESLLGATIADRTRLKVDYGDLASNDWGVQALPCTTASS